MQDLTVFVAFGAGLLSFLSPCVLPLIPVYFASMAGSTAASNGRNRLILFYHSIFFVSGLTLMFTLLGAGVGLLGLAIGEHIVIIRRIAGSVMILMGLVLLLSIKVLWLNFEKRIDTGKSKANYLRSLITEVVFALG